jgi:uncharacterized membrane protein YphA (DoxX/SURF4 family)
MLNPFPIQFLSLFAYFILRIFIGFILLVFGFRHWKQRESLYPVLVLPIFPFGKISVAILIISELVIGTLFVLGLYTQIAALITILMSIKMIILRKKFSHPALPSRLVYFLFLGISCSLFITGAGVLAFDLPI